MHRKKIVLSVLWVAAGWLAVAAQAHEFNGARAMDYARKIVAFGPRPPGSAASRNLRAYILAQLKLRGREVIQDSFTGNTPLGPIAMVNIIARFPGKSGRAVVLTGHYDTKKIAGVRFVGADDGGSSTAFLLEMAETLQGMPHSDDIYLVWFDGEEAFGQWSDTDSLYGSRHLAAKWAADGTLRRIAALINVDMIGDRDLDIRRETSSTPWLTDLIWSAAKRQGLDNFFVPESARIEDDHLPFLAAGVPSVDIIDLENYQVRGKWHTAQDTLEACSARSLQVVGDTVLAALPQIEARLLRDQQIVARRTALRRKGSMHAVAPAILLHH